jgi:hypothetical protein
MELLREIRYEGEGSAEFGNPLIRIEGPTIVETDECGRTTATMQVSRVPTSPSPEDGFGRLFRDFFQSLHETGEACKLWVDTPEGRFIATDMLFRGHNIKFGEGVTTRFNCHRAQFLVSDRTAKFWRLPILNFRGALPPATRLPRLDHCLRLSTISPTTSFQIGDEIGFLEYVEKYEELLDAHKNGDRTPRITAFLVGAVTGGIEELDQIRSWFPFGLLNLLGLSSGSRVGASWIEFFDESGVLVQRSHVRLGTNHSETGEGFFNVIHQGGLGRLITCAMKSPEFDEQYVRVALNHLLLGNLDSQALEDKIFHFGAALDALTERFGFATKDLLYGVADEDRAHVRAILSGARGQIRDVAKNRREAGEALTAGVLDRIADRTFTSPTGTDRDFGLAVVDLLQRFGLHDSAIANGYYVENSSAGRSWPQLLSHYRGISQHGGAFGFERGEHDAGEIFRFANHLGDILIRILLKQLGYDGEYQRRNAKWSDAKNVDWVVPGTPPYELGFGKDLRKAFVESVSPPLPEAPDSVTPVG